MNIAVFCSSSNQIPSAYKQAAFQLGQFIAESGNTLVYGGSTGGTMDDIALGAKEKGGKIIGVIAQPIIKMHRQSTLPTEQIIVENLSERKNKMKQLADVFVVLPGSYGTFDEMLDVIASGVVGEHHKPLVIVNEQHFFDDFIRQINKMKVVQLLPEPENYQPVFVENIHQCKAFLQSFSIRN
jgi:uncharacterized protein (TIGR00730 family)